jgi:beta-phosphoglucomutase-like phosphatase (HAD superfamily)
MKAILFDFDGTLVNSQPIVDKYVKGKLKELGIILHDQEDVFTSGMSVKDFAKWLFENKGILVKEDDLIIGQDVVDEINLFEGAKTTLALCKSRGYKIALVSNSPRNYVDLLINKFNIGMYFDTTITEDESLVPKPNPKMLEMACENIGVKHNECVMIDDNPPGISAGNELGMITIRIGNKKEEAKYVVAKISQLIPLLEKIHFTRQ